MAQPPLQGSKGVINRTQRWFDLSTLDDGFEKVPTSAVFDPSTTPWQEQPGHEQVSTVQQWFDTSSLEDAYDGPAIANAPQPPYFAPTDEQQLNRPTVPQWFAPDAEARPTTVPPGRPVFGTDSDLPLHHILNWTDPAPAGTSALVSIEVYRSTDPSVLGKLVAVVAAGVQTADDYYGLLNDYADAVVVGGFMQFYYSLIAVNAEGIRARPSTNGVSINLFPPNLDIDHQQDAQAVPLWTAPEASVDGLTPQASAPFNPAFGGLDWTDQTGQQDRSIQPSWFRPSDPEEGLVPLGNAAATPYLAPDDQSGQQDRAIGPTWFAPEASVEGPVPIAAPYDPSVSFAAIQGADPSEQGPTTQPQAWNAVVDLLGIREAPTDATFDQEAALWTDSSGQQDRSIQPVWSAPDASADGFVPITAAAPFNPATGGFDWSEQPGQERATDSRWFRPDDAQEGLVPQASAPATPYFAPDDWSGQQDRSLQPVWVHPPDATEGLVPTATPATVDQYAAAWTDGSGQQDRGRQPTWWQPEDDQTPAFAWLAAQSSAIPPVLVDAETGDIWLYLGGVFIVRGS